MEAYTVFMELEENISKMKREPSSLGAHQYKSGLKNCDTFPQWNTMQQKEIRGSYPSRQYGWIWRALC